MTTLGKLFVFFVAAVLTSVDGKHLRLAPSAQLAGENEFPHQVSIQLDGKHLCGGALISKRHVLTAGHCVRGFILDPTPASIKGQRLVVEVGSTRIGRGTRHAVKRVSQKREFKGYSKFNPIFMPNDIAVITLRTAVTESAKVKTIDLPAASSELDAGTSVKISGFGNAYVNGPTSSVLKTSPMRTVSHKECNDYWTRTFHQGISKSQICAKYLPGHGACEGDSGSPLIHGNTVIGVVSGGNGVCGQGHPDVYTKVSHFLPYIKYELNHKPGAPEDGASPALAVDIGDSTPLLPPGQPPTPPPGQQYPYPGLPGDVQFIDPNTGALLPPGSVVLVDTATGLPVVPVTPGFPQIPLYPLYPLYTLYPVSASLVWQYG